MSDARVSIEVHGTSDSPMWTCINSADERVVCTEYSYNFEFTFCSLCLSCVLSLSVCVFYFTLPHAFTFTILLSAFFMETKIHIKNLHIDDKITSNQIQTFENNEITNELSSF